MALAIIKILLFLFVSIQISSALLPNDFKGTFLQSAINSTYFYYDMYRWLMTDKYQVLSKDNEFAPKEKIYAHFVSRIGPKATDLLLKNCLRHSRNYKVTLIKFAFCSLVVLDEEYFDLVLNQRRSDFSIGGLSRK